jgi:galactofuranose transport system substrate-binding protein
VLREAKEAGIPVLVTDRKIQTEDPNLYAGFIGTDSEQEGRAAASFLLGKFAGSGHTAANPVRIIEISGTEGSSPAVGRAKGFRETIADHTDFQIIYSESGDFLRSRGYEIACSILARFTQIDAIFAHNDAMTLGALDAIRERGISPGKQIVIVTIDAEQAAIDALKAGKVNCVVECNPNIGPQVMVLAKNLATGVTISRLIHVDERVFSETDPDLANIPPRGY